MNEFETLKDSLDMVLPYVRSIAENSAPAPYTYINIVITVIAAIAGILGAYYGWQGYKYAKMTADNVVRRSSEIHQRMASLLLMEAFDFLVRLLVWRYMQDTKQGEYISKKYLTSLKFHSLEETFQLESFNNNADHYLLVYELKGRLQAYNVALQGFHDSFENTGIIDTDSFKDVIRKQVKIISVIDAIMVDVLKSSETYVEVLERIQNKYLQHTKEIQKEISDGEKEDIRIFVDNFLNRAKPTGVHEDVIDKLKDKIYTDVPLEYKKLILKQNC